MNKLVMPETVRAGDCYQSDRVVKDHVAEAHHAAWEAHCAALESRLREVEARTVRLRESITDWGDNMRSEVMADLLAQTDELTAALHPDRDGKEKGNG